jgi:hypothetical protein
VKPLNEIARLALAQSEGALHDYVMRILALLPASDASAGKEAASMDEMEDDVKTESKAWAKDTARKLDKDVQQEVDIVRDRGIAEMASLPERLSYSVGNAFPTAAELGSVFNEEWSKDVWKQIEGERAALGLNISNNLWDSTKDAQNQINDIIKQSETEHWAYSETKDKLAELLTEKGRANVGYNTRRLWVDQVKRNHIVAQRQQWTDTGYIDTIILSRSETGYECDICGEEIGDGPGASIEVPMDYAFLPPYHPWCGCTASPKMPTKESMRAFLNGEVGSPKVMALMAEKNPTLTVPMLSDEELAIQGQAILDQLMTQPDMSIEDIRAAYGDEMADRMILIRFNEQNKTSVMLPTPEELAVMTPAEVAANIQAVADQAVESFKASEAAKAKVFEEFKATQGTILPEYKNYWTIDQLRNVYGDAVADEVAAARKEMVDKGITTQFDILMTQDYKSIEEIRIFYGDEMADKVTAAREEHFIVETLHMTIGEIRSFYGDIVANVEEQRRNELAFTEWRERDQRAIDAIYTEAQKENAQFDKWRDFTVDKGRLGTENIWTMADGTPFDSYKEFREQEDNPNAVLATVERFTGENLAILVEGEVAKNESYRMKDVVTNRIADALLEFLPSGYTDDMAAEITNTMRTIRIEGTKKFGGAEQTTHYEDNIHNAVEMLIHSWAVTSSSGDAISCAAQEEALRVFGLDASYVDFLKVEDTARRAMDFLAQGNNQDFVDAFLKAMYVMTQRSFMDKGITELTLFRGMGVEPSIVKDIFGGTRSLTKGFGQAQLSPMSSFSLSLDQATLFCEPESSSDSNVPMMFGARIPVERIIGSFLTGYGCAVEQEFVVLGPQVGRDTVFGATGEFGDIAAARVGAMLLALSGEYTYSEKDIDKGGN